MQVGLGENALDHRGLDGHSVGEPARRLFLHQLVVSEHSRPVGVHVCADGLVLEVGRLAGGEVVALKHLVVEHINAGPLHLGEEVVVNGD